MKDKKIKIGITHGDINGISYEIIIKTLLDTRIFEIGIPIVYGSPKIAAYHRKALNIVNFSLHNIRVPEEANPKRANIINCVDDNIRVELGKPTEMSGESSVKSLQRAVDDLKEKKIDVLVTSPINKKNIQSDSFQFTGHTEYLSSSFEEKNYLMLMVSDILKVGVVTSHIPVSKVPESITQENIINKLKILNLSLIKDFAIRKPRIAVLGLNPHAGEDSLVGTEENDIIIPAIKSARDEEIMAFGPYPADGFFGSDNFSQFDATLAMYHDQGLAPFKALAFYDGVNYTAGLPIIRTSPSHGTGFEIAGKNQASPDSFRQAMFVACNIFKNRIEYEELTSNPLRSVDPSEI